MKAVSFYNILQSINKSLMNYHNTEPQSFPNKLIPQKEFEATVFDAFKNWGTYARSNGCTGIRFRVESNNIRINHYVYRDNEAKRFLPIESDKSFKDYEARILKQTNGRLFQGVVNNLQRFSSKLYDSTRVLLDGLYLQAGFPIHFIETGIFVGNYPFTPHGVHWDYDPVISLMLQGSKKLYTWDKNLWEKIHGPSNSVVYKQYIKSANSAIAKTGEWLLIPKNHFHVLEPNGFAANFSLTMGSFLTRSNHITNAANYVAKYQKFENLVLEHSFNSESGEVKFKNLNKEIQMYLIGPITDRSPSCFAKADFNKRKLTRSIIAQPINNDCVDNNEANLNISFNSSNSSKVISPNDDISKNIISKTPVTLNAWSASSSNYLDSTYKVRVLNENISESNYYSYQESGSLSFIPSSDCTSIKYFIDQIKGSIVSKKFVGSFASPHIFHRELFQNTVSLIKKHLKTNHEDSSIETKITFGNDKLISSDSLKSQKVLVLVLSGDGFVNKENRFQQGDLILLNTEELHTLSFSEDFMIFEVHFFSKSLQEKLEFGFQNVYINTLLQKKFSIDLFDDQLKLRHAEQLDCLYEHLKETCMESDYELLIIRSVMDQISSSGFSSVPPLINDVSINERDNLNVSSNQKIFWNETEADELLTISYLGKSFCFNYSNAIVDTIKHLNSKGYIDVKDYLNDFEEINKPQLLDFLTDLANIGVFTVGQNTFIQPGRPVTNEMRTRSSYAVQVTGDKL